MTNNRELLYLLIPAALVIVTVLIFSALAERKTTLSRQVGIQEKQLQQVRNLLEKQNSSNQQLSAIGKIPSLIGHLERLANGIKSKEKITLNELKTNTVNGLQGVRLKADGLNLDEVAVLVHGIESAKVPIKILQFEMGKSFQNEKRLRVSMRIVARK